MCTVTIVPGACLRDEDAGRTVLRVVFSRDERRRRRAATPPAATDVRGRRVLMPTDGAAGGTWIAATDAGLVLMLLNVTEHVSAADVSTAPDWPGRLTRGAIIPSLAGAADLDEAARSAGALDPSRYAPFVLLCVSASGSMEVRSDGLSLSVTRHAATGPWMRTSSSLGDRRVVGPRQRLFDAWFRDEPFDRATQDGFHRHFWPEHRELSVLMARPDARTVSITTVELSQDATRMEYEDARSPGCGVRA